MAFAPIGTTDGSDWHAKLREVEIAAGVANTFLGDMMALSGTASADARAEGVVIGVVGPSVAAADARNLAGAIVEFTPDFTDEGTLIRNFHLTGAAQFGKLVYGNDVIYEAPVIGTGLAITDVGTNREFSAGAGGSLVTGIGTHGIDGSSAPVALGQLRLIGASRTEDDSAILFTAVGATWRCRLNVSVDDHRVIGA